MFQIDDKVIWIEPRYKELESMTYGKTYNVIDLGQDPSIIWVYDDFGYKECWHEQRFILDIKYLRRKKLQRCFTKEI